MKSAAGSTVSSIPDALDKPKLDLPNSDYEDEYSPSARGKSTTDVGMLPFSSQRSVDRKTRERPTPMVEDFGAQPSTPSQKARDRARAKPKAGPPRQSSSARDIANKTRSGSLSSISPRATGAQHAVTRTRAGSPSIVSPRESVAQDVGYRGRSSGSLRSVSPHGEKTPSAKLTADELNRNIAFAGCSIAQLRDRIIAEEPDIPFHVEFWQAVLSKSFAVGFQPIKNRTLSSWVQTFNKWQELREDGAQDAPAYVDTETLGKLLCLSNNKLYDVVRLFDVSPGIGGDVSKARIHMPSLFSAGVLTSQHISTKHKLAFILGLFDLNDNGALDKKEFGQFVHCFTQGMVFAYGILDQTPVPPKQMAEEIANRYYERIAKVAAQKIKELFTMSDKKCKEFIEKEVRKRLHSEFLHNGEPGIKYEILRDWCLQATIDPLGVPYALALQRYCPMRFNTVNDADEYTEAFANFKLSHKCQVPVPARDKNIDDVGLITRKEFLLTLKVFDYCKENDAFEMPLLRVGRALSISLPHTLVSRLEKCMMQVATECERFDFFEFIRVLMPKAQARHMRMYENWYIQHNKNIDEERNAAEMNQAHKANIERPVFPRRDIEVLKRRFQELDTDGSGFLEPHELVKEFGLADVDTVKAVLAEHDISGDALIDEVEFLKMNCPPEYRLPYTDEDFSTLSVSLGRVLSYNHEQAEKSVRELRCCCQSSCSCGQRRVIAGTFPEIPDEIWRQWNQMYDKLDHNNDGLVEANELYYAGVLSEKHCRSLVSGRAAEEDQGITRRSFLESLLEAHGWWRQGFSTSANGLECA